MKYMTLIPRRPYSLIKDMFIVKISTHNTALKYRVIKLHFLLFLMHKQLSDILKLIMSPFCYVTENTKFQFPYSLFPPPQETAGIQLYTHAPFILLERKNLQ